jgi:GcrA cell cycle regulator
MSGVRNPNTDDWTEARERELRRLKAKGYSAAQIAKQLGGTTRNAVIGKLGRMGLNRRGLKQKDRTFDMMANSPNPGVKTKAMRFDISPAELLRPRRFFWEEEGFEDRP